MSGPMRPCECGKLAVDRVAVVLVDWPATLAAGSVVRKALDIVTAHDDGSVCRREAA